MILSHAAPYGTRPDGFRLPDETHVGRVRLQIADLDRSLAYYEQVLGLSAHARSPNHAELGPENDDRVLVELHQRPGARPRPPSGTLGLYHFAILLPDRGALGRFLRHAILRGAVSGIADHAVSEAVYLTDPDGLGVEVYADRPRTEWRREPNGQLHMTTVRLNVEAVIAAGGDKAWTGAPPATTMGHVHLHVGDLGQAEAFYHRALGFDKIVWTYPGALFFSAGGYHHHLGTNMWTSGGPSPDDQARLLSWDLETSEPDVAARSLTAAGYAVSREEDRWIAPDPWGTVVEIRSLKV